jgi:hypothetical protein
MNREPGIDEGSIRKERKTKGKELKRRQTEATEYRKERAD